MASYYKICCPECGQRLRINQGMKKSTAKCPACSSKFNLPAEGHETNDQELSEDQRGSAKHQTDEFDPHDEWDFDDGNSLESADDWAGTDEDSFLDESVERFGRPKLSSSLSSVVNHLTVASFCVELMIPR